MAQHRLCPLRKGIWMSLSSPRGPLSERSPIHSHRYFRSQSEWRHIPNIDSMARVQMEFISYVFILDYIVIHLPLYFICFIILFIVNALVYLPYSVVHVHLFFSMCFIYLFPGVFNIYFNLINYTSVDLNKLSCLWYPVDKEINKCLLVSGF